MPVSFRLNTSSVNKNLANWSPAPDMTEREEDFLEEILTPEWKDTTSRERPISRKLLRLKGNGED